MEYPDEMDWHFLVIASQFSPVKWYWEQLTDLVMVWPPGCLQTNYLVLDPSDPSCSNWSWNLISQTSYVFGCVFFVKQLLGGNSPKCSGHFLDKITTFHDNTWGNRHTSVLKKILCPDFGPLRARPPSSPTLQASCDVWPTKPTRLAVWWR